MGHLAKAYPVQATLRGQSAEAERSPTLTIAGEHRLSNRDQVVLVHPQSGLKRYVLEGADSIAAGTELHIRESLDPAIDAQWVAIPLARRQRMSPLVAVLAVLAIGAALGLIHGLLITKVGHQPFVVTLCGLLIYRGISRWLARDQPLGFGQEYKETLSSVATGKFMLFRGEGGGFGIPYPFFILLGIAVVAAVFLNRTIWGRYMLALGRNKEAAEYSGINTSRMIVIAYVICTSMAAVGGMLFALDANSVAPSSFGNFFELYAIAAAVLGGCSLRGGEGGIVGVVIGTALMQTLNNVIVLKQIPDQLEFAIIGAVILIGVTADEVFKRWAARDRGTKTNSISTGQSK
ncbi:MAG: ABC transporter permease [Planctomycetales bacterium]|nr:ABC transporter permease [Planctomycetales bacterium]